MFKVNNKDTKTTSMMSRSFLAYYILKVEPVFNFDFGKIYWVVGLRILGFKRASF